MKNIIINTSEYAKGKQSDFDSDDVGSSPTLEIYKCIFCGKEFKSKQALGSHTGKCKQNPNATNAEQTEAQRNRCKVKPKGFNLVEVNTTCEYCGKFFKYSCHKTQHIKFFCTKNPNNMDTREAYAKKCKETQQNVWKNPKLRKEQSERTVFNNFWKYRAENPIIYESKIAGKMKLDSNWELLVAKRLDELNVEWFRPRVRLPYFDSEGVEHGYFPDFYVKTFNCFIEVKSNFIAKFQNSNNKCEYVKEHYPFVKWIETKEECSTFSLSDLKCDFVPQKDEEDISYWLNKIEQKKNVS